jgi:hypothetical protein
VVVVEIAQRCRQRGGIGSWQARAAEHQIDLVLKDIGGDATPKKLHRRTVAITGSAAHSPNAQTLIAQVDWAPWGNNTNHWGYPWLNVRVGVQYRYYLQFNGGTTNYDGFGRNASDNNTLLVFSFWSF